MVTSPRPGPAGAPCTGRPVSRLCWYGHHGCRSRGVHAFSQHHPIGAADVGRVVAPWSRRHTPTAPSHGQRRCRTCWAGC